MLPCDGPTVCPPQGAPPQTPLEKALRFAAVGTMLMTGPQVLAYGIRKRDATICFANAGWVVMDLAIIVGLLARH